MQLLLALSFVSFALISQARADETEVRPYFSFENRPFFFFAWSELQDEARKNNITVSVADDVLANLIVIARTGVLSNCKLIPKYRKQITDDENGPIANICFDEKICHIQRIVDAKTGTASSHIIVVNQNDTEPNNEEFLCLKTAISKVMNTKLR